MLSTVLRFALETFVKVARLPHRPIRRDDGRPYLERYYLCGPPETVRNFFPPGTTIPFWQRPLAKLPLVYLHHFRGSDEDPEVHSHPWTAKSLILVGGYREEFIVDHPGGVFTVVERDVKPGDVNVITPDHFHRVELLEKDAWSLIVVGERVASWGFRDVIHGRFTPWKEHLAKPRAR